MKQRFGEEGAIGRENPLYLIPSSTFRMLYRGYNERRATMSDMVYSVIGYILLPLSVFVRIPLLRLDNRKGCQIES